MVALFAIILLHLLVQRTESFRLVLSTYRGGQNTFLKYTNLNEVKENLDTALVDVSKQSFLVKETTETNFDDEEVECTSESGTWNYVPFNEEQTVAFSDAISRDEADLGVSLKKAAAYNEDWGETVKLLLETIPATAENAVKLCDRIDQAEGQFRANAILRFKRMLLLGEILRKDKKEYMTVATFLGNRIPRDELPNLQNIPYPQYTTASSITTPTSDSATITSTETVEDCALPKLKYEESPLEKLLLSIFRGLVQKEISFKSDTPGILGLLEEGRHYKFTPEGVENDSVNQHKFVKDVLGGLLTPVLPPFYRIFMAGIVPSIDRGDPDWLVNASNRLIELVPDSLPFKKDLVPGKQYGPWFYAPFLTSAVTPPFLSFLLGPSRVNLRSDGQLGGMVVKKCKFLQESNCKGLCLHQCKLPAQQFFQDSLGMPLTVVPNFETQECQWSWGQVPIPHTEDPDFPKGCIKGCETRSLVQAPLSAVAVTAVA